MRTRYLLLTVGALFLALACDSPDRVDGAGGNGGTGAGGNSDQKNFERPAPGLYEGELDIEGWEGPLPFALGVLESEGELVVSLAVDQAKPSRATATWTGQAVVLTDFQASTAPWPSCHRAALDFERLELRFEGDRVIGAGEGTAEVFELDYFYDEAFALELAGERQETKPPLGVVLGNTVEWAAFEPIQVRLGEPGEVLGEARLDFDGQAIAVDLGQLGRQLVLTPAESLPWGREGIATVQVEDLLGELHVLTFPVATEDAPIEPPDPTLEDLDGYLLHGAWAMKEEERNLVGVTGGIVASSHGDWSIDFELQVPDSPDARLEVDTHDDIPSDGSGTTYGGPALVRIGTAEGIVRPAVTDIGPEPDPGGVGTSRWTLVADLSPWRGERVVVSLFGWGEEMCGWETSAELTWISRVEVLP